MTNEVILKKAIEKAKANGWNLKFKDWPSMSNFLNNDWDDAYEQYHLMMDHVSKETLIFSHDFAKAFWGEEEIHVVSDNPDFDLPAWQFHLQQMVIQENPISYLERFLND